MRVNPLCFALLLSIACAAPAHADDVPVLQVVARSGDAIGAGETLDLTVYSEPRVGPGGRVSVLANAQPSRREGLYVVTEGEVGSLRRLLEEDQATPALDGRIRNLQRWTIADDGTAYVAAFLENVTQFGNEAVYRIPPIGAFTEVLRSAKPLGSGMSPLCEVNGFGSEDLRWQPDGDVLTQIATDADAFCRARAIYRIADDGETSEIVALGASVIGTGATLDRILNNSAVELLDDRAGTTYFLGGDTGTYPNQNWYLIEPTGVRRVASAINGDEFASRDGTLTLHDTGTDVITQHVAGSTDGDVAFALGALVPDGSGRYLRFDHVDVGSNGDVLVVAVLTGTPGGTNDDVGVYLKNAHGIVELAREGKSTPSGTGRYYGFGTRASLNAHGDALFDAEYRGNADNQRHDAIYHYDFITGMKEVVREGMAFGDVTVASWYFDDRLSPDGSFALTMRFSGDAEDAVVVARLGSPIFFGNFEPEPGAPAGGSGL